MDELPARGVAYGCHNSDQKRLKVVNYLHTRGFRSVHCLVPKHGVESASGGLFFESRVRR